MILFSFPEILIHTGEALQAIGWAYLPLLAWPLIQCLWPDNTYLRNISHTFIKWIDALNYRIGEGAKWALPLLVLSVAFSVFALSIFGQSWTKLFESAIYLHTTLIMLGAAATLRAGEHVCVDIFYTRMKPQTRALVHFCGFYILLMPVCIILIQSSQSFVYFSWLSLEGSTENDGIKAQYLLKSLIPAFAFLILIQAMSIALSAALYLRGHPIPQSSPDMALLFEDKIK